MLYLSKNNQNLAHTGADYTVYDLSKLQLSKKANTFSGFRRYRRYKQHLTTWQLALILMAILRGCFAILFGGYNGGIRWKTTPQTLQFSTMILTIAFIGYCYLYLSLYVIIDERLFVV